MWIDSQNEYGFWYDDGTDHPSRWIFGYINGGDRLMTSSGGSDCLNTALNWTADPFAITACGKRLQIYHIGFTNRVLNMFT